MNHGKVMTHICTYCTHQKPIGGECSPEFFHERKFKTDDWLNIIKCDEFEVATDDIQRLKEIKREEFKQKLIEENSKKHILIDMPMKACCNCDYMDKEIPVKHNDIYCKKHHKRINSLHYCEYYKGA